MRVTSLELVTDDETFLKTSLQAPLPTDRFHPKAIYGLDPDELIAKFYGFGGDNTAFYRVGMKAREITMRLVLRPNWELGESYSDLRDDLYRAISKNRGSAIQILLKSGPTILAETTGYIRRFEVPFFNKDPELQITLECPDPFFRSYAGFEFLTADFDSTGYISLPDQLSTAPHGFEAQFTVAGALASFVIQDDNTPNWSFSFTNTGGAGFIASDILNINTNSGKLEVKVTRSSVETALMDSVDTDSIWPILFPGDNQFYLPAVLAGTLDIDYVRFDAAFWGV
jgi:hypothetical protein